MQKQVEKSDLFLDETLGHYHKDMHSVYTELKSHIADVVIFRKQTPDSREYVNELRNQLKQSVCKRCVCLGGTTTKRQALTRFTKDETISKMHSRIVLTQTTVVSERQIMACEGCDVLKLKQFATGFIKGRKLTFK